MLKTIFASFSAPDRPSFGQLVLSHPHDPSHPQQKFSLQRKNHQKPFGVRPVGHQAWLTEGLDSLGNFEAPGPR